MEKRYIELEPTCTLQVVLKSNKKLLLIKKFSQSKYVVIPSFLKLQKKNNSLILFLNSSTRQTVQALENITQQISNFVNTQEQLYNKKLLLKGLGFRITFSEDGKKLLFKIGYSFIVSVDIIPNISVKIKKTCF